MADVFISYTRADAAKAALVAAGFQAEGRSVFYDVNLVPGDSWDHRIERELNTARSVVVLWSPASRDRQWVRNEARDAMRRGILCPATIETCEIPLEFSHVQAADLRGMTRTTNHPGWAQLMVAVDAKIAGPRNDVAVAPLPGAPVSPPSSSLPSHLSIQLEQALREAVADHARRDLKLLHPQVRIAVESARRSELAAIAAQHRALHAVELAEDAARRARAGDAGYRAFDFNDANQCRYEGGWSDSTMGCGILAYGGGALAGDHFAGHFRGGVRNGPGVHYFGVNAANVHKTLRHEGEFANDRRNGLGILHWRDGTRHAGNCRDDLTDGPGTLYFADGQAYEGEWANGRVHGAAALWDAAGRVTHSGLWTEGKLTTPLAR